MISRQIEQSRFSDLTPLDCFLYGYLKKTIYRKWLHTIEELKSVFENTKKKKNRM